MSGIGTIKYINHVFLTSLFTYLDLGKSLYIPCIIWFPDHISIPFLPIHLCIITGNCQRESLA